MAMNPNWPRWIKASIVTAFKDALDPFLMYVEEADRDALQGSKDFCELRVDGPYATQQTASDWQLAIEINVLVSSIRDTSDAYKLERNNGLVCKAFATNITVFRYGSDVQDDQGIEGCLILRSDKGNALVVSNFGAPPDVRILQSSVEGHYKGQFVSNS